MTIGKFHILSHSSEGYSIQHTLSVYTVLISWFSGIHKVKSFERKFQLGIQNTKMNL